MKQKGSNAILLDNPKKCDRTPSVHHPIAQKVDCAMIFADGVSSLK